MEGNFKDRKHRRIASLNLVSYTHFDSDGQPDLEDMGRTKDLGEGGILLECTQSFPIGDTLEIEIAIHDDLITTQGEIMRVEPVPNSKKCDVGIKFTEISERHKDLINRFLTEEFI